MTRTFNQKFAIFAVRNSYPNFKMLKLKFRPSMVSSMYLMLNFQFVSENPSIYKCPTVGQKCCWKNMSEFSIWNHFSECNVIHTSIFHNNVIQPEEFQAFFTTFFYNLKHLKAFNELVIWSELWQLLKSCFD